MSDPPPRPLETIASSPRNESTSQRPWREPCGAQRPSRANARGERGNDPGGYGRPRSRTSTRMRPASSWATMAPPNPEPTTTTSNSSRCSGAMHGPRDRPPGVGLVAAEGAGVHGRGQLAPEARVLVLDARDRLLQRAGDVHAGALRVRGGPPVASAEADGGGELAGDEVHLLSRPRRALGVVEGLGLLDLLLEVLHARAVGGLRRGVKQGAGVAAAGRADLEVGLRRHRDRGGVARALGGDDDVDRVDLYPGPREQQRKVAHALRVADVERAPLEVDAPDLALAVQDAGGRAVVRGLGGRRDALERPLDARDPVAEDGHAERRGALAGGVEEPAGGLRVAGLAAAGEHPRLVEVEDREHRRVAEALAGRACLLEPPPRRRAVLARGRRERPVARDRPGEDALRGDDVAGRQRLE